jgi:polyhydroxybutyrate depolymerase
MDRVVNVDGMQRSFTVFLPDKIPSKRKLRVMFVFHPATGTGKFMEDATKLHETPGSENFIVVYPDGFRRTWNAGDCCGLAEKNNIDDVAFFRAMMKDVGTLANIRPKAYLTGYSNGALLVYYLLCHATDEVAAAAPFAAYLPPADLADCGAGPVPLLHMHGDADEGAPVEGGQTNYLGLLPPARQTVEAVARINGADVANPTYIDMPDLGTSCLHYQGLTPGSEANLCIIPGLGHVWPGMKGRSGKFGPSRPDLHGSRAVMTFFLKY